MPMRLPHSVKHFFVLWTLSSVATVVGLALLTGMVLNDHGWWGYLRLVNAGVTTRAVVVRTDRGNHCLAEYSFVVEGQSYSGSGADCTAQVGQVALITYLRSNPKHSCLGLARDALENELVLFAVTRWRRSRGRVRSNVA